MSFRLVAVAVAIFLGFAIAAPFGTDVGMPASASIDLRGIAADKAMPASHHGVALTLDQNAPPPSHACPLGGEASQCRCSLSCMAAGLADTFHGRTGVNPIHFLPSPVANLRPAGTGPADPPPRA